VCGSTRLCVSVFSSIVLVSFTGMFQYMFVMSNEARFCCGSMGVFFRSCSNSCVFFMLKRLGLGLVCRSFQRTIWIVCTLVRCANLPQGGWVGPVCGS